MGVASYVTYGIIGFRLTQSDLCVYTHGSGDTLVILTLRVDDILPSGQAADRFAQRKKEDRFEKKDMSEVKVILEMEVNRNYEGCTFTITQENHVNSILERFGMHDCNPVSTPWYGPELSVRQPADKLFGATVTKRYQSMTGSLLHLAQCTRHDLCYAVNQLTRACKKQARRSPHDGSETRVS